MWFLQVVRREPDMNGYSIFTQLLRDVSSYNAHGKKNEKKKTHWTTPEPQTMLPGWRWADIRNISTLKRSASLKNPKTRTSLVFFQLRWVFFRSPTRITTAGSLPERHDVQKPHRSLTTTKTFSLVWCGLCFCGLSSNLFYSEQWAKCLRIICPVILKEFNGNGFGWGFFFYCCPGNLAL